MLIEGLYGAIGQIDAALDSLGMVSASKRVAQSSDEVPAELVQRAQLEPHAWGQAFEGTTAVSGSYAQAQQELARTLAQAREDLVWLADQMKAADADLERVDEEVARTLDRLRERLERVDGGPAGSGLAPGRSEQA